MHYWLLDSTGKTVPGRCRTCGAVRTFLNTIEQFQSSWVESNDSFFKELYPREEPE